MLELTNSQSFLIQLNHARDVYFNDFVSVFAYFGVYYVVKKCLNITACFTDTLIKAHILGRLRPYSNEWWTDKFGPWAGKLQII